ncbi:MAG: ATP-binding protein [Clostridia bacterium]|nr:ATP-binding protein [Clostridia bacterium]
MEDTLSAIVEKLIQSRREGDWWDFKREHHHDKADLVHDITCMANSRANRDAYIIFGVEDQSFSICGVENDPDRRNQQGIVDILRSVGYAGSVRPRIELRTITLEQHEVDVLIVKNTYSVPYYL